MALDQYTQDLDEYLDRTKNQILRDLLAKGHRLSDIGSPTSTGESGVVFCNHR